MAFRPGIRQDDLWIGEMVGLDVGGRPVLLVNVGGEICAYENRCRHRSLPLSLGKLTDGRLVCAAHGWEYDACTGEGVNPTGLALRRYPVRLAAGDILVDVEGDIE
jgi:toluene monooxygenase system ferredoxin subunit